MAVISGTTAKALILTAALLGSPGCAHLDDVLHAPRHPSARTVVVDGEVSSVEARKGRLRVRTYRNGTRTIYVDRATRVIYGRREYEVRALERGDLVRVYVEIDRRGDAWADRIDVRESVNERRSGRY